MKKDLKKSEQKAEIKNKNKKKRAFWELLEWPIKVFFITIPISIIFGISSELLLSDTGVIISIVTVVFIIVLGVFADLLGVAVAAADVKPFLSMASKKVRGATQAIGLIKNADVVSNISADVIGDVCGILTGAVGAAVAAKIYSVTGDFKTIIIAAFVGSLVTALTVFGKAIGKKVAVTNPNPIIYAVAKVMSLFGIGNRK